MENQLRHSSHTRIKNLCDQMAVVGITKTSEELARRCIRILSQKYDALVTTLNTHVRNPPLTFEEFSVILLEEEMLMKTRDGRSDAAFSVMSKGKGGEKKNGKKKKFSKSLTIKSFQIQIQLIFSSSSKALNH